MINLARQYIFIHLEKTGGTSVSDVLLDYHMKDLYYFTNNPPIYRGDKPNFKPFAHKETDYPNKHTPVQAWMLLLDKEYDKFFKFTFVRNPYDRALSLYLHHCKVFTGRWDLDAKKIYEYNHGLFIDPSKIEYLEGEQEVCFSFKYFVENFLPFPISFGQVEFMSGGRMDWQGKMEHIDDHFKELGERIGIEGATVPKLNVGGSAEVYDKFYTPELKEMVYERFKEDFEQLGYDK